MVRTKDSWQRFCFLARGAVAVVSVMAGGMGPGVVQRCQRDGIRLAHYPFHGLQVTQGDIAQQQNSRTERHPFLYSASQLAQAGHHLTQELPAMACFVLALRQQPLLPRMEELLTANGLVSLLTLSALEIVLGIDNIIFISIVTNRLPGHQQGKARSIGLTLALVARVMLLFGISWIVGLKADLFQIGSMGFSGRDLILLAGGLFLVYKTLQEIVHKVRALPDTDPKMPGSGKAKYNSIIWQIVLIDIVFSFDSILTAVGLVSNVYMMIAAVVIAMGIMLAFSAPIAKFVNLNPTIKMLALVFLVVIGALLIAESMDLHINKAYVYVAMAFSLSVELLNLQMRKNQRLRRAEG